MNSCKTLTRNFLKKFKKKNYLQLKSINLIIGFLRIKRKQDWKTENDDYNTNNNNNNSHNNK